ncbi:uncharacterized protein LOC143127314 isoform X2 [Alosa pseudoharengus]|uniref:uncharacterized protein LOC143127314 isoform X2 n=1 Tax=Alosa pseudoharengus TaxID=34774 RepID=UPI003F8B3225
MKWCIICLLPLMALALASREYHYIADPKTWTEAQTYCREKYTDLATIRDKEEMQSLNELSFFSGGAWIGLFNKLQNWPSKFTADKDKNSCLYFWIHGGIWTPCPCNLTVAFVCHDVNQYAPYGFNLTLDKKNWTEAQRECQQKHTRLATLRNQEEKDYLKSIIPSGHYGVHMDPYGDGWTWSDDSTPFFVNWLDPAQKHLNSSNRCVASLQTPGSQGRWETQSCTERLPFFCLTTTSTPKPQAPPDVTQVNVVNRSEIHLKLQWTKVNNNRSYNYTLRDSSGQESSITGSDAFNKVTHTVSSLSPGTKYSFILFTVFEGVRSTGFNFSEVTVPPYVTQVNVVTRSETRLVLEWTKVNNNNNYEYILRDSNGAETSITGSEAETTVTHTISSLSIGTEYSLTLFTLFEEVRSTGFNFSAVTVPVKRTQIVRVELQVNSSLNLKTPEVQEVLLHQIKVKLQENGLPADVKLSWIEQTDGQIFHKKKDEKRKKEEEKNKDEF